jgi:DNA-binding CsgD family transcriptional regulator
VTVSASQPELIAEDLTSKEIASRMGLSVKTVLFHRQEIKRRLKVRGTAGIVRYAVRHGIIEP